MDIFNLQAKIDIDDSDFTKKISAMAKSFGSTTDSAKNTVSQMVDVQAKLNATNKRIAEITSTIKEFEKSGDASDSMMEELNEDLAEAQVEAKSLNAEMEKLNGTLDEEGDEAEDSEEKSSKLASVLGGTLKGAAVAAAAAFTTLVTGAVALGKALISGVSETAQYGDNVDKMSQKMGITAKAYQEWDFVMQHCGSSMDTLKTGMKTLATAAESGSKDSIKAFKKLGISEKELGKLSQEELFDKTIAGLQSITDTTERTYLSGQLLGGGAAELGALLNMTAEETAEMKQQLADLGGLMDDKAVKSSATFQDSLQNLKVAFDGIKRSVSGDFLDSFTTIMDGLSLILSGGEGGAEKLTEGVQNFLAALKAAVPKIKEALTPVIKALWGTFIDSLPDIVDELVDVVMQVLNALIEAFPQIVDSLIDLIPDLIDVVMRFIDAVIAKLPIIIEKISSKLPTVITQIIDLIVKIITAVANNITQILDPIIKAIPEIIKALVKGIIDNLPAILDAIEEIIIGIIGEADKLSEALSRLIPMLIEIIVEGLVMNFPKILELIGKAFVGIIINFVNMLIDGLNSFLDLIGVDRIDRLEMPDFVTTGTTIGDTNTTINVNVDAKGSSDPEWVANQTAEAIEEKLARRQASVGYTPAGSRSGGRI